MDESRYGLSNSLQALVWPATFYEALIATVFAIALLSVGFFNPWAIPIWTLFTGSYNASMLGIYVLIVQMAAIPFGITLVLFACAKYLQSAIVLAQAIHLLLLLTCVVLGALAIYECSLSHGPGGCYY